MVYPDAAAMRREREMDYEVVFAGRHIVIALKSGLALFDTFAGAATGYGAVSKEFRKIVDQVTLGVPITQAIRDVVQNNPSKYFTRLMMQMANAVSSGSDVGDSIESVLDQISQGADDIPQGIQPEAHPDSHVLHDLRHHRALRWASCSRRWCSPLSAAASSASRRGSSS